LLGLGTRRRPDDGAETLHALLDQPGGLQHVTRRGVVTGGIGLDPGQPEGVEGVVDHQSDSGRHHPAAPGVGVGPIADLARAQIAGDVEEPDRAEQQVGPGVGDRPALSDAGGAHARALPQERAGVLLAVRRGQLAEPALGALVPARLHHPRGVVLAELAQPHPRAVECGRVEPAALRLTRIAGQQGADPRVAELAAMRQPLPEPALDGEAEPPGEPA